MTITIKDIHKRLKLLPESLNMGKMYHYYLNKADSAIKSGNPSKIMKLIEVGINDIDSPIHLSTMVELYDALVIYGTLGNVKQYGKMLCEDYTPKIRDAKETQTYFKRKLGRLKAKTTKASNAYQKAEEQLHQKLHQAQDNINAALSKLSNTSGGVSAPLKNTSTDDEAKQEVAIQTYENMINECTKMIYCDRILENYNRISRRFNIDRIIQENIYSNGIEDTINEICHLVETYDVPDKVKYNTTLETVWYGFNKNYVDCSNSTLVTTVTDYFLAKGNNRKMCSKLLEASMIVKKDDYKGDLEVIQEEEPEEDEQDLNEASIQDLIRDHIAGDKGVSSIQLKENTSFNSTFEKFRASDEENKETKLKFLIRKLYSKNVDDILDGTPSLLNYIRIVFVLGSFALNPVLGAVAAIADVFISLHYSREETQKMIKFFDNEIEKTNNKIESTKDSEDKNRLKAYKKELEKGKEKLNNYYEEMLTDKELDTKYDEESNEKDDFKDILGDMDFDDDDFNFDDDDFGLDEAVLFIPVVAKLSEAYENLPLQYIEKDDIDQILSVAPSLTYDMSQVSFWRPDLINPDDMKEILDNKIIEVRKNTIGESKMIDYKTLYSLKECRELLDKQRARSHRLNTIYESAFNLKMTNDLLTTLYNIKDVCNYTNSINEASITNTITLASEKLKKMWTKLSDKEKQISKNIDVAANNTKKAVEKSLTTDNRESVIKGSILPSASKTIKLAITGAGLYLLDPVLAVIGVLGFIGVNKKYKAKERQMIIDELEIELKMCEKYIDIAESKNDMKALKKLLTIQRELERQLQRIKYKMKVDFGQKYYDAKAPNSNND